MRPSEAPPGAPVAWLIGRALEWQVVALAAPLLAWRTGLALAGGWAGAVPRPEPAQPPGEAAGEPAAEEVDHLA